MLFVQSVEPKEILTWVLLAVAVVALGGLVARYISMYVKMKRDRATRAGEGQQQAAAISEKLLEINGEYLVMRRDVEYSVGDGGQIVPGEYILKSANGGAFTVLLNGQTRDFSCDEEIVTFTQGETICPLSCSVLIKPKIHED